MTNLKIEVVSGNVGAKLSGFNAFMPHPFLGVTYINSLFENSATKYLK